MGITSLPDVIPAGTDSVGCKSNTWTTGESGGARLLFHCSVYNVHCYTQNNEDANS